MIRVEIKSDKRTSTLESTINQRIEDWLSKGWRFKDVKYACDQNYNKDTIHYAMLVFEKDEDVSPKQLNQ